MRRRATHKPRSLYSTAKQMESAATERAQIKSQLVKAQEVNLGKRS
jgi:hypothetical protein